MIASLWCRNNDFRNPYNSVVSSVSRPLKRFQNIPRHNRLFGHAFDLLGILLLVVIAGGGCTDFRSAAVLEASRAVEAQTYSADPEDM
jgi:hypothetical protein